MLAITAIATVPALLLARAERHDRTMPPAANPNVALVIDDTPPGH